MPCGQVALAWFPFDGLGRSDSSVFVWPALADALLQQRDGRGRDGRGLRRLVQRRSGAVSVPDGRYVYVAALRVRCGPLVTERDSFDA